MVHRNRRTRLRNVHGTNEISHLPQFCATGYQVKGACEFLSAYVARLNFYLFQEEY